MINSKIKIEPRVIQHLGQDLITSPEVAVVELLKNSIDAEAENMNIHIFKQFFAAINSENFLRPISKHVMECVPKNLQDTSVCIIEDDGSGMSPKVIEQGFLSVGTDNKVGEENTLGEKGIGRLSTQRLGKTVLVETVSNGILSFLFLNWDEIINGKYDVVIHDYNCNESNYTRLWIFDIHMSDYLNVPDQISFDFGDVYEINSELRSAIGFLISPFDHIYKTNNSNYNISVFYEGQRLESKFEVDLLQCAESDHYFHVCEEGGKLKIEYGLKLRPWYIERMHKVLSATPQAFNVLRKKHAYYTEFLCKYEKRINTALNNVLNEDELVRLIIDELSRQYKSKELTQERRNIIQYQAELYVKNIKKILPMESQIYSFKQNVDVGEKIILESVREQYNWDFDIKDLKRFLSNSNGVKLYRNIFRIGFLGNKENDWIKLQQYRTKGQQFYRFDLGNTIGYVSINDSSQKIIREISSRLDLIETQEAFAFKYLINLIFNRIFYDLNRTANGLIKTLLREDGLLKDDVAKRIKQNSNDLQKMQKRTEEIRRITEEIERSLQEYKPTEDGTGVVLSATAFNSTVAAITKVNSYFVQSETIQAEAIQTIDQASEQLRRINADLYNNYKLMANGMITEAITHELDSVSKTSILPNAMTKFDALKQILLNYNEVSSYNDNLKPLRDSYSLISGKLSHVADLYNFLEATFIRKGSYDIFENEIINETVMQVQDNLALRLKASKIDVNCFTGNLAWYLPRGVLLHVLYNLFTNSTYWINQRKKWASDDAFYRDDSITRDFICVEKAGDNAIIVYDSGTGVIAPMEDVLFEALQSGKDYSERRGMGLYIVQQLLQSFEANIELLPERNKYGNRYKFMISYQQEV